MNIVKISIVLGLLLFAALSMAQQTQTQTFIVGVEEQLYYPHSQYKDKQFSGYAREFLDAFALANGYHFEYRVLAVDELFKQLIAREIDFKYPDNSYWQPDLKEGVRLAYSDPVSPFIDGVFVAQNNKGKGIAKLKTLGVVKGFTPLEYDYLIHLGKIRLVEAESIDYLIKSTLSGELDGFYGSVEAISYQLAASYSGDQQLVFDPQLPYMMQSYKLSTASRPRVLKQLNTFIKENAVFIERLLQKYGINSLSYIDAE